MYVVNVILDGASLDESAQVFSTKSDAHLWHRRMGHCNPRALQQPAEHRRRHDLSRTTYAKAVLDGFGMADARSAKTPAEPGQISIMEEGIMSPEDINCLLYTSPSPRD